MERSSQDHRGRARPAIRAGHAALAALLFVAVCGLILLGTRAGRQVLGVQQTSSAPSVLRPAPGFKGVAVSLPRDVLVLRLLQDFSNFIGEPVYADGAILPASRISLEDRPSRLDVRTMTELLKRHSYELSLTPYRGERVYWVQKLLIPRRKKGGLRPAGSLARGRETDGATDSAVDQGREAAGGESLCLYRRQEGDGSRYVVLFETGSKDEAEAALSLLQAHQKSRAK